AFSDHTLPEETLPEFVQVPPPITPEPNEEPELVVPTPPITPPETLPKAPVETPRETPKVRLPTVIRPLDTPPPPKVETGQLRIAANYPADVYIKGKRRGSTRGDDQLLTLPVGSEVITIKGALLQDYELKVEIAPNEVLEKTVELRPRKFNVTIDDSYPPTCIVVLNRLSKGAIEKSGRVITIDHPDRKNEIILDCDGQVHTREFTYMTSDAVYPPPPDQP
ncbi:MAG: hypothetical protein HN348_16200, partial [Proteobacteria bacterium]|nr:hypothetical protein [Pseudomonadota bacterium]